MFVTSLAPGEEVGVLMRFTEKVDDGAGVRLSRGGTAEKVGGQTVYVSRNMAPRQGGRQDRGHGDRGVGEGDAGGPGRAVRGAGGALKRARASTAWWCTSSRACSRSSPRRCRCRWRS